MRSEVGKSAGRVLTLLLWGALLLPYGAGAQTTTGTLRGTVKDETGGTLPGASVEAVNDDTGFRLGATTGPNGFYNLSAQPGPYTVTATLPSFTTVTKKTRVLVGQTQGLDFELKLAARAAEAVTVSGEAPVIEAKSNEIATNVTEQQIKYLPQGSRNFLNFAELAPGVRVSDNQQKKEINGAGAEGFNTNVFIDGTSYKNDVLEGGVTGQDSSRGNPFPQNAVQEFRVMSQNFKAEYEKATTTIITAVTKSGTNALSGDVFTYYQDKRLVARDPFVPKDSPDPDYTRWQAGADVGGPIVKDKVHFFGSYELNYQNRSNIVFLGSETSAASPALLSHLQSLTGVFTSPFRSNLAFGKLSWQAGTSNLLDVSGFYRHETDIRDFGNQTSYQHADNVKQNIWNVQGRYSISGKAFLSESTLSYQNSQWNPTATNPDLVAQNYFGLLLIGAHDTSQNFRQKRFALREDFSYLGFQAAGDHVVKAGVVASFNKYDVQKFQLGVPEFRYRPDISFDFPFEAGYGVGNPDLSSSNNEYGFYVQDDWTVTPRLTVNAGIRWDYETDMLNNNYVTPAQVRTDLQSIVPADYFTNGDQRPAYKNMWQPRVGFSYDLTGKATTVVFGGYGRYFDRDIYNYLLDEKYRLQYAVRTFRFSADGAPRDGQPTIKWDPSFLSVAGLNNLIALGIAPKPEVFLVNNNTKPPVSDQFSFGIRQAFGPIATSIAYAGIRGRNGYTYVRGNRNPDGTCCVNVANYSGVFISEASKRFWYDALFLTVDKPYTTASKWGLALAYTWGHSTQTGNDLFSLDFPTPADFGRRSTNNDERHRIVFSGIVGIPWDVRASALITLGSGLPIQVIDASKGFGINQLRFTSIRQSGTFPYQSWDLRLQKDFPIAASARVGVVLEGFNLTNHRNYGCFNNFLPPEGNPNLGKPGCLATDGRRAQFGVNVGF
jgi:outer membrane receptor protein involved in Fe transport